MIQQKYNHNKSPLLEVKDKSICTCEQDIKQGIQYIFSQQTKYQPSVLKGTSRSIYSWGIYTKSKTKAYVQQGKT